MLDFFSSKERYSNALKTGLIDREGNILSEDEIKKNNKLAERDEFSKWQEKMAFMREYINKLEELKKISKHRKDEIEKIWKVEQRRVERMEREMKQGMSQFNHTFKPSR